MKHRGRPPAGGSSGEPSLPEGLAEAAAALGVSLGADKVGRLLVFEELLRGRAVPLGLIAEGDAARIRTRHVLDCLRAALAVEEGDRDAYDLGSGAGLPGIVVAVARPSLSVTLVESIQKRAAFLELAVEELGLANASVAATRAEALHEPVDLCFARALASLGRSWDMALPILRPLGRLVYFAGEGSPAPDLLPGAGSVDVLEAPLLARSGPLVIMTRQ